MLINQFTAVCQKCGQYKTMTEEQKQDKRLWFSAMIKYFKNEVAPLMVEITEAELSDEELKAKCEKLFKLLSWNVPEVAVYDTKHICNETQPVCENYDGTIMEVKNENLWVHDWFARAALVPRIILDLLRSEPYLEEGWNEEKQEQYSYTYQVQPGLVQKAKDYFYGWENLTIAECKAKMSDVIGESFYVVPHVAEDEKSGIGIFAWFEQKLSSDEIFT